MLLIKVGKHFSIFTFFARPSLSHSIASPKSRKMGFAKLPIFGLVFKYVYIMLFKNHRTHILLEASY